ncbi:alpha/beta fold hydrolase, partial [Myxococcota bacterium]|nr:alpha/beta fold hydrolase [Myxococcota bacterium]
MQRIELEHGTTAFDLAGPEDGRAIVLVHGLMTPSFVWDATSPHLARRHRVLRYDLLGRGASDRPQLDYGVEVYVAQLDDLVTRLLPGRRVTLVAYSWGAGFASSWAARSAARVEQLVLVAPGGLGGSASLDVLAALGPAVVRWPALVRRLLARDLERCFVDPRSQRAYFERFFEQLARPGFERAFVST